MTRRLTLALLALFFLVPAVASAKATDAAVKSKLESAIKLMDGLAKAAAKDAKAQTTFRTGVIALRAAQQARRAGKLDDALALASAGHAAAENKTPPSLASLEKSHANWIKPSIEKVPGDWGKLSTDWKTVGQLLPENILDPQKIIPDMIMEPTPDKP